MQITEHDQDVPATEPTRVDGERLYNERGWSGCDGSAWRNLPPAVRDPWELAAKLTNSTSSGRTVRMTKRGRSGSSKRG